MLCDFFRRPRFAEGFDAEDIAAIFYEAEPLRTDTRFCGNDALCTSDDFVSRRIVRFGKSLQIDNRYDAYLFFGNEFCCFKRRITLLC